MVRVAVLDRDLCKPEDCGLPCLKYCPKVRVRVEAIKFVKDEEKPIIVEFLCSGCGICIKKCPFKAITIVNLPDELKEEYSHSYGQNLFKLFRLPIPKKGVVTGLIGRNGTGKTTALKILSGELIPNLGNHDFPPAWKEIIRHFRGSILQEYFGKLSKKELKVIHKPQHIDKIPSYVSGSVLEVLSEADEKGELNSLKEKLQLNEVLDRPIEVLSGGELQRVAIAMCLLKEGDVYVFDEPSSHLDVNQRLQVAKAIRGLKEEEKTVILTEHDLAMLDYLSDQVCIIYGEPGVYGIVSHPYGVKGGINVYLNGYIPDENMRFRAYSIRFHLKPPGEVKAIESPAITWEKMEKSYEDFVLYINPGEVRKGEVLGVLGPNGIGKTTFIKLLAGIERPSRGKSIDSERFVISYKPQYISTRYSDSVQSLLMSIAKEKFEEESFIKDVIEPLRLPKLFDRPIEVLSGGELQRVAIAACLAKSAHIYLIDEPSAYLDIEERITVAKAIRKTTEENEAFAFVVEHDLVAQDFIADKLMVFDGKPGLFGVADSPVSLREGMNKFLTKMEITFRRDPETGRPRVNKPESKVDKMQKDLGEYYYVLT
ncbi:MAG: ribosome biogenesis/translation initiation ATPase RLI [Candidatus Bathyarchaeia archaeon]